MKHSTHNNTIHTDDILQPGYVSFDCAAWDLPDNTCGGVGLHVCYRPLCSDEYEGNELVTDAMRQAVREHYDSRQIAIEAAKKAEHGALMASLTEMGKRQPSALDKAICPKCGTVCYGDC